MIIFFGVWSLKLIIDPKFDKSLYELSNLVSLQYLNTMAFAMWSNPLYMDNHSDAYVL